eukprot:TRINITY_DN48627_c0_g1_i1.p1 TRINITY_DN48627_c0_g1~~TRINITY_DN48627_c0_g1_i1.p1  ORF type:complete len:317 (+),score=53.93 TRINITY_DN48627_c0_g1_i1:23-973(+)
MPLGRWQHSKRTAPCHRLGAHAVKLHQPGIARAAELADASGSPPLLSAAGVAVGAMLGLLFAPSQRPRARPSPSTTQPTGPQPSANPSQPSCFAQLTLADARAAGADLAGDFWLWRKRTELCEIMESEGSDKSTRHNYTPVYERLFSDCRASVLAVCEIGLGTNNEDVPSNMGADGVPGASHRGWRQFFPYAQVYGGDVDSRVLFQEERIQTGFCDQTVDGSICKLLSRFDARFDLMIDDGLHEFDASLRTLREAWPFMRSGGVYVVEDVEAQDLEQWRQVASELPSAWLEIIELPNATPVLDDMTDNCLVVLKVP